jgi:hypothetical protein
LFTLEASANTLSLLPPDWIRVPTQIRGSISWSTKPLQIDNTVTLFGGSESVVATPDGQNLKVTGALLSIGPGHIVRTTGYARGREKFDLVALLSQQNCSSSL